MKGKIFIYDILLLAMGVILIFSGFILFSISKTPKKEEKSQKEYTDLFEIANELYGNSEYLELPEDVRGAHYLTIGEYKKRGYSLDFVDTTCPDNFAFIFFDIKNEDKYENYPIYIIQSCHDLVDAN